MIQHLSIRVPWHDNDWNGNICKNPGGNVSCLRLKGIHDEKNDEFECQLCGKCMLGYEKNIPCIPEGGAFMSKVELHKSQTHPYKEINSRTHGHFLETDVVYPPYSLPGRPFRWLMYTNKTTKSYNSKDFYGIKYNKDIEPELDFNKKPNWIQEAANHRAIFNYFYQDIQPEKSLCIVYAKQVPFVEDYRRVIIGIGHVKKIVPAVEHNHTNEGTLTSMVWETMIEHSIREDNSDGFIIPYKKMMKYAEEHPDFDISTITVFAPDDAFNEFSYATEHVKYDTVIEVIMSCIKSFKIISKCLNEDYSNIIEWLNTELSRVWEERGQFPGLGEMLTAFGIKQGIPMAREIKNSIKNGQNLWKYLDQVIEKPNDYLPNDVAICINSQLQNRWKSLPNERKQLFQLLSRFSLSIEQACFFFDVDKRKENGIDFSDKDVIENPYVLYERTRLKNSESGLYFSVKKVDLALFPAPYIADDYPLEKPTKLEVENDERRIRAIIVSILENEANNGHTILPIELLIQLFRNIPLEHECEINRDIIKSMEIFLKPEVIRREMKDGMDYYKLARINEYDIEIERRIKKRVKADKIEIKADWKELIDDEFGPMDLNDKDEKRARAEKEAVLKELSRSRISVLVGDAGTGKTSVLSILCNEPSIAAGGVLLLAPTGKATVRLMEKVNKNKINFEYQNIAQFLSKSGRFSWTDMRYKLSDEQYTDIPETVIIDEASMLTEEMFGALIQAIEKAKRIIFSGDPNQLPPIGAGRPFVDLVDLLREKLPYRLSYDETRVCNCYAELRINRRQKNGENRLDVRFAECFARNSTLCDEEEIISEIVRKKGNSIEILKWNTKEELEDLLLKTVASELGMEDINDQDGFDKAIGGTKNEKGDTVFKQECAKNVDLWQILSPIRNMPNGVCSINRLFHKKYRGEQIEMSKKERKERVIPKALGSDQIVYGDKVINVQNTRDKKAYPIIPDDKNYIANGETGIACGYYSYYPGRVKDYLQICFSTQRDVTYSYTKNDFSREGPDKLELAYALTIHKSQGSQFKTVILVISEPCILLSRELLYTALTRQENKLIILYNNEPYHLLNYQSSEYSQICRRFTDLFAEVFPDEYSAHKPYIIKNNDEFFNADRIHVTAKGEKVRTKSEVIIGNALYSHKIPYEYEAYLELDNHVKRPDFKIEDSDTGKIWYWEHCGYMSKPDYEKSWRYKEKFYAKHGIVKDKNLIVTYEQYGEGLNSKEINDLIEKIFN